MNYYKKYIENKNKYFTLKQYFITEGQICGSITYVDFITKHKSDRILLVYFKKKLVTSITLFYINFIKKC